jgi:hypothetical protein
MNWQAEPLRLCELNPPKHKNGNHMFFVCNTRVSLLWSNCPYPVVGRVFDFFNNRATSGFFNNNNNK